MEIVIDIPEEEYELVRHGNKSYRTELELMNAVAEGKPLPEHHGRLIDADTLEEKVEKHREMLKISEYDRELVLHYTDIEMAPTIIERE